MSKVPDRILNRVYILFALLIVFSVAIVAKVVKTQWVDGDRWMAEQANRRIYAKTVRADRGSILAEDGSVLATTLPYYRAALDATVIDARNFANFSDSLDRLCRKLEGRFGAEFEVDAAHFKGLILRAQHDKDRHVYLLPYRRLLDFSELKWVRSLPILNRGPYLGGLIVEKVNHRRFYPLGELGRSTLGRIDDGSHQGSKGLEYSFNAALRGRDGQMYVQRLAGDVEIPLNDIFEKGSRDGLDIRTTLDVNMQDVVSSALRGAVEQHRAEYGTAVLMEVSTGKIKAIANWPEGYNHAIATQLEPGSTFKIASVIAALEDKHVKPEDSVDTGKGYRTFGENTLRDDHAYGKMTYAQAVEKSSNVALAELIDRSYRSNPQAFYDRLEQTGVLGFTDFQIRGEPQPLVIRPNSPLWSRSTLPWLAIGYNVKLTPLQILNYYNAIANGGQMMRPYIVSEVFDANGVQDRWEPQVLKEQIASAQTLQEVRSMLEGVVQRGTARRIKGSNYSIAGKTGTAKKVVNGEYRNVYHSSFVGYFPADQPRYSCIVLISEPSSGQYYGADIAAPVFRTIADNIYSTLLEEQYRKPELKRASGPKAVPVTSIVHQADAVKVYNRLNVSAPDRPGTVYARATVKGETVHLKPYPLRKGRMPAVRGMTARDALALLENLGLRVHLRGSGKVYRQSLRPGTPYKKGETVTLDLD